jgi:hypothetical protein
MELFSLIAEHKSVDINATNSTGTSALHVAAELGFSFAVRVLIDKGAQITPNTAGNSPLHLATDFFRQARDQSIVRIAVALFLFLPFRFFKSSLHSLFFVRSFVRPLSFGQGRDKNRASSSLPYVLQEYLGSIIIMGDKYSQHPLFLFGSFLFTFLLSLSFL